MSGGIKYDAGKSPVSLIPVEAILGEANVFAFGAKKYGRHNFRKGMDHTRVLDAALRHLLAIVNGEDLDPESGQPHWAHARCCLAMYAYYQANNVGTDDRYKGEPNDEEIDSSSVVLSLEERQALSEIRGTEGQECTGNLAVSARD